MHQRHRRTRAQPHVAVKLLEIVDPPLGDDDAGERAGGRAQATGDRKHPLPGVERIAARGLDDRLDHLAGLQRLEQQLARHIGQRVGRLGGHRAGHQLALCVEQHQLLDLHQPDHLFAQEDVQIATRAGVALPGDVTQHQVHRLQAARRLLGDDARMGVELARGVRCIGAVAAHDVVGGQRDDGGDEHAADPRDAAPREARGCGGESGGRPAHVRPGAGPPRQASDNGRTAVAARLTLRSQVKPRSAGRGQVSERGGVISDRQHQAHGGGQCFAGGGLGQDAVHAQCARHRAAAFDA